MDPLPIAPPEPRDDLLREIRDAECLGTTSDGKRIHVFKSRGYSSVMRELGRLREIAFRDAGEGTGRERDVDVFDTYYRHVLLWDEADGEIVGAYRIGEALEILAARGARGFYSHTLFDFGDALHERLPAALELGRSFVQPRYQGLRSLDSLWQGVGAYVARRPQVRYLFGPVSVSAGYPESARKLLVYFYRRYFGLSVRMAHARRPFVIAPEEEQALAAMLPGNDYARDFRALKSFLNEAGVGIPTLYKQYTELCDEGGAHFLGFGIDPAFAGCLDGLVWVDLERVKPAKRERYLRAPGQVPARDAAEIA